ncbi:MAG: sulfite exporter TauE/SafE family protein [Chitinophagaceae bacterium]|nr:sulfite exporter TauE/SafE family protein [Chitinophagaceae bacterium]
MWQFITGGLILGFFSSMHCVGMCGPLALALPVHHLPNVKRVTALLSYHLGRIFTYASLGLVFGFAGRHLYIAGFQQWFSIAMGVTVLVLLLQYYYYKKNVQPSFMQAFYKRVQQAIITLLKSPKNIFTFPLLGIANGLLPCGMVYVAVAAALTSSAVHQGVLFMTMFGLGTLPALMTVGYWGTSLKPELRRGMRKVIPYGIGLMAVVLILRGMNLGIPFISPVLQNAPGAAVECHK